MTIGDSGRPGGAPQAFGKRRSEPQGPSAPASASPPPPPHPPVAVSLPESTPPPAAPPAALADPEELARVRAMTEEHILAFLASVGLVDIPVEQGGWRHIRLGSAGGRVGIIEWHDEIYLQVESYIMDMPSDRDLIVPLMRELLELNYLALVPARASIIDDKVFVTLSWPASVLDENGVADCIHAGMSIADEVDDELIRKYDRTVRARTPLDRPIA